MDRTNCGNPPDERADGAGSSEELKNSEARQVEGEDGTTDECSDEHDQHRLRDGRDRPDAEIEGISAPIRHTPQLRSEDSVSLAYREEFTFDSIEQTAECLIIERRSPALDRRCSATDTLADASGRHRSLSGPQSLEQWKPTGDTRREIPGKHREGDIAAYPSRERETRETVQQRPAPLTTDVVTSECQDGDDEAYPGAPERSASGEHHPGGDRKFSTERDEGALDRRHHRDRDEHEDAETEREDHRGIDERPLDPCSERLKPIEEVSRSTERLGDVSHLLTGGDEGPDLHRGPDRLERGGQRLAATHDGVHASCGRSGASGATHGREGPEGIVERDAGLHERGEQAQLLVIRRPAFGTAARQAPAVTEAFSVGVQRTSWTAENSTSSRTRPRVAVASGA